MYADDRPDSWKNPLRLVLFEKKKNQNPHQYGWVVGLLLSSEPELPAALGHIVAPLMLAGAMVPLGCVGH